MCFFKASFVFLCVALLSVEKSEVEITKTLLNSSSSENLSGDCHI